ncbi:hypothetical protein VII00023_09134 [Vibrio ichthyoenteri ATCC 700023]|uniref:Uncharacterized protein n=1 Tax=Vibrio ichthyoenteri ATCC 700023 TaxID=870968 RepID=F9S8S6_9VIBR|nr:hypothetical protein [Vibrio ichthyoenteri]EGU29563.1 hypothetical protein VII00023_09134 [Vibrio ichthyoenteri ATCC 700023]
MLKNVKVSELKNVLNALPTDCDLNIVTGDEWLPEQLVATSTVDDMLFLQFDNAPEDIQGEEGRGFVDHEIEMIRHRFEQIITENSDTSSKADALLALFLIGHEQSSGEVIEILESAECEEHIIE